MFWVRCPSQSVTNYLCSHQPWQLPCGWRRQFVPSNLISDRTLLNLTQYMWERWRCHVYGGAFWIECNILMMIMIVDWVDWLIGVNEPGARSRYIIPVSCNLHWLPVRQRITFKTAVLVSAWHGPAVPSDILRAIINIRQLVTSVSRMNSGDRSIALQESQVWNNLPAELRVLDILLDLFRNKLKDFCLMRNCRWSAFAASCDLVL